MNRITQTHHGYHGTKLYRLWADIKKRCECEKSSNYNYYGGRGITMCEEWRTSPKQFIEWALNNGYEIGLEIDRVDNSKSYSPDNCQFITHAENCAILKRRIRNDNKSGERNIVKTKANTYEAYFNSNGKQKFIKTFPTIAQAIKARNNAEIIGNIHDNKEESK